MANEKNTVLTSVFFYFFLFLYFREQKIVLKIVRALLCVTSPTHYDMIKIK